VLIHLRVHRFRRGNDSCTGQTFAEQVSGLTIRYGRRSIGAGEALQAITLVTEERREAAQGSPTPRCDYRRVDLRSWPYMTKSCSRPFRCSHRGRRVSSPSVVCFGVWDTHGSIALDVASMICAPGNSAVSEARVRRRLAR
jgi:hypothetical protein